MTDRKKPGVTFWATVVVVGLVLYVLSFVPACWLCDRDALSERLVYWTYRPLATASIYSGCGNALCRYGELLTIRESPPPVDAFATFIDRIPTARLLLAEAAVARIRRER